MNEHLDSAEPLDPNKPTNSLFIGRDGLRPFWGLLIYVAILATPILIVLLAARMAGIGTHNNDAQHEFSVLSSTIAEWLEFGFVFFATWIMSRIEGKSVFDYGLQLTSRRYKWLLTGALWGVVFMSLLIGVLWSTHHLVIAGVTLRPAAALGYGLAWALSFVGVGFFEECLFRGYLQFNLTRCFSGVIRWLSPQSSYADSAGFWIAAFLISFGFGFVHRANPGESPIGLLCAALAGLMFVFVLWRTGSLWWAIGLHAAWDWSQSFLYGVADSGALSKGHLLASHPAGSTLMSGGLTGPEGSVFVLPVMVLIAIVIAITLPRDPRTPTASIWTAPTPAPAGDSTLA
jgi:uncharacterized protein